MLYSKSGNAQEICKEGCLACKDEEIQRLRGRVIELERQLAEAQAVIQILPPSHGDRQQTATISQPEPHGSSEINVENLVIGEASAQRAIYLAPYPLMIRREDGRVVMINAAWTKISGYALEDIPTIDEWTRKAYGDGAPERKSEILNEGFSQTDIKQWGAYEITTLSGEKRIWDFSTAPLGVDQQGRRLMMAMAVDVTDHNQVEEDLRAARDEAAWLARFPGENPNPVVRVSNEGIVLYCNAPAASLRGWRCAVNAALSSPLLDLVDIAVEQGQVVEQDMLLGDKFYSVSVIPFPQQGYLNLYGKDITERKQAEQALAESERRQREIARLLEVDQARLAAILQHLPVGVWIADQTGRLIGSNEQADHIWAGEAPLANSPEEYQRYESWYPENGKPLETEEYPLAIALRTGQPVEPVELKIRRFDGSEGTVLVSAAPIKDRQGTLTGAVGVNVDITERQQMEEALKASSERVNDILRSLRGGLLALDRNWSIIYINDEAAKVTGLPIEALIGKNLWKLWPELLGTPLESFYRQAMQEGAAGQQRIRGIQSGRWYDVNVSPSSEGITIFYEDKTGQILAEERFNKAFHASPNALVISRQQDGRMELINDTFVHFFGYSREEVIGKSSVELGMFVNAIDRQEAVHRLQNEGFVRDFELDVRLKSGEVRNASLSVERIEIGGEQIMLTAIQDITLRKQAEKHIAYQAGLLATVNDAIVGSDAEFRLTAWNAAAESVYGWRAEEVLGQNGVEILQTHWPQEEANEMRREIAESGRWRGEATQLRKDGTRIPVEVSSMVLRDEHGQITGYVSVNRDITERKKAEAHINDLLALNEKILNHSSVGILSYKVDGQCVFANEKVALIVGTTVAELLTQNFHTIAAWKNSGLYDLVQRAISTQSPATADLHHLSTFGKDVWMTAHCITFQSKGEDHILLSISDITERKQAEQALLESEQRLKRAQEIAHLGSWELDLINDRLTWSDEVYRIFGLEPQQFAATYEAFLEAVHPDDRAAVDGAYSSSIREGRDTYEIEHRVVRHANGEVRIVHEKCEHLRDLSGQILRSGGMVHDITERKQAEQALRESEERFHCLADSMPQLVWTALPDGTVDYYNQRYREYYEIKQVEGAAWQWAPVLHRNDLETTVNAWQRSVKTGEIYQIEHQVRMSGGSYRWHLSRGVPVRDESGQVVRWFGTSTDIHDLKLAEEQLKVYAERLERSNRELEQFAFMASHDLQEPLRKIEMFGDLLLERAPSWNEQERDYVDRMRNASGRMRDMVEGLLQLSRITTQAKPFIPVDLSQVTSEVLHDLEGQIRLTNGRVNIELLPTIEGDALQLHQLMQNLIGNALKYHQPGIPPEVNVYAKHLSGKVQILVEDKGIGFAQEDAEGVFQPFQRLVGRSQYEGSGMGLAICRRIVERHGGEISALSQPGRGTTFMVTLPIHHLATPRIN